MIALDEILAAALSKNYKGAAQLLTLYPELVPAFIDVYCGADYRMNQRLMNVMDVITKIAPQLLASHHAHLIKMLEDDMHDAYIRNTLRYFQFVEVEEDLEGPLYDVAYVFMSNPRQAVAIRAFAMQCCVNLALKYPELKEELTASISMYLEDDSPGILSRSKKMLAILKEA